jgi:hypothetical protein
MPRDPSQLIRQELAQFLPSQRAIRAFEKIFDIIPNVVDSNEFASGNALATAQEAIDSINRLSTALELLATAPEVSGTVTSDVAEQSSDTRVDDLVQQVALLSQAPPLEPAKVPRYGTFYDTTTQTAAAINTAYALTFNTTDLSFGVRRGTPTSRIYVDSEGVYNFQFSLQLDKVSGGVGLFYLWARINGLDQTNSATQIRIQGNNAETVAAWNFVYKMNAGDYFELVWSVDTTDITIQTFAAAPPVPGIPSAILTVTNNIS